MYNYGLLSEINYRILSYLKTQITQDDKIASFVSWRCGYLKKY